MRISIREQLAALILLASCIGLSIISIATWVTVREFVLKLRSGRLTISASLKASELATNMALMENSVQFVGSRVLIQEALQRYNDYGNNSASNWVDAVGDMQAAVGGEASGAAVGQALLLQSMVFPRSGNGPNGAASVLNTTGNDVIGTIKLPYNYPNGTAVYLGDDSSLGYPPNLYPNVTYVNVSTDSGTEAGAVYNGDLMSPASGQSSDVLVLGPWVVNSSLALMSLTIPLINNTSSVDALGWLTVLLDARLLSNIISNPEGLDETGEMLLIRPVNSTNQYPPNVIFSNNPDPTVIAQQQVQFALPLASNETKRHPTRTMGKGNAPFNLKQYPVLLDAVTKKQEVVNNAGSNIKTHNEAGFGVAVGYAFVNLPYVDWAIIIEETIAEVWSPIYTLRKVLLACVFGTLGGLCLIVWPLAHVASKPIRELRAATLKSVMPPGYNASSDSFALSDSDEEDEENLDGVADRRSQNELARKEGFVEKMAFWKTKKKRPRADREEEARRRQFRIPGKVKDRKHVVKDELTDLTTTFNEMSDELMMQYERLEERVRQRTAELETSKKAAEAANESKTLFIANISHELKTPLNGILGMCAVCMQEDDPIRLKRSLGIIYKSGDLLLNLLTDLLTFSKNQVGQQLSLDEKDFRLRDVSSQIHAIFEKQAKESQIDLRICFQGGVDDDSGELSNGLNGAVLPGVGRVKDMILWGDTHRILQVVINLVSNSLKFTPPGGMVTLTVRCLGDATESHSRKTSLASKTSKKPSYKKRHSDASFAPNKSTVSLEGEKGGAFARVMEVERAPAPPGRVLLFEFEVVDTGPGIPENIHQRIFEPFVQGDLGLSKKYGGTGLGLSICSQLAGLMKGSMHLESQVGQGSKFTLRIPLRHLMTRADSTASSSVNVSLDHVQSGSSGISRTPDRLSRGDDIKFDVDTGRPVSGGPSSPRPDPDRQYEKKQPRLVGLSQPFFTSSEPMESPGSQPAAMEQITAAAESSGKIRVLVAEDNKVNQEVVLRMLKLEDIYDVTVAKDGQEALDVVKASMSSVDENPDNPHAGKGPFNLIFMDVQMPNLDGLQSTKLIREIGYDAPIVALTAFAEESNVKDCLDSGMNFFLSKPIRRPALKKVLKEYCAPIQEVDEDQQPVPAPAPAANIGQQQQNGKQVQDKSANTTQENLKLYTSASAGRRGSGVDIGPTSPRSPSTTFVVVSRPSSADGARLSIDSPTKRPMPKDGQ